MYEMDFTGSLLKVTLVDVGEKGIDAAMQGRITLYETLRWVTDTWMLFFSTRVQMFIVIGKNNASSSLREYRNTIILHLFGSIRSYLLSGLRERACIYFNVFCSHL